MQKLSPLVLLIIFSVAIAGCGSDNSNPAHDDMNSSKKLDLTVGEKWRYEFSVHGDQYGFNECEVIDKTTDNDETYYTIASELHLQESDACLPTTASGTLQVTDANLPVAYQMNIAISSG